MGEGGGDSEITRRGDGVREKEKGREGKRKMERERQRQAESHLFVPSCGRTTSVLLCTYLASFLLWHGFV